MRRCTAAALVILALALGACAGPNASTLTSADAQVSTAALKTRAPDVPQDRAGERPAEAPARKAATVKVGLMLPLSGPGQAALIAETMKKAAELALAEAKAPHVTLLVRDDKATPEGATSAAQDLASQGVEIILGPLFARSVQSAATSLRQANIPLVAFSNDRQVAGQGVSLISFLAEPEVQRIVAHAASKGKKRFAALIPADAYGRLVETAFRAAVGRQAGQIVAIESYPTDQANAMAEAVRKLRDSVRGLEEHGDPVDALFLPGGEEALAAVSPHLKQNQFDLKRIQVLGTGAMDFAQAGRDPQLHGAWFAGPDPKGWQTFSDRFASRHGHAPPRIASLAYDAVMLAVALSNGPDGARYIPSQLSRASGFDGVDGRFTFTSDGAAERPLAILEVQAFGTKVIEAAPAQALPVATPAAAVKPQAAGGILSSIPSAFPQTN
jgi:branched-chain amino acid transport system substrate-binding protein